MRGNLRDFDLGQVLSVTSISRQYLEVEIRDENALVGMIFVKSGKIVNADTPDAQGREALFRLFQRSDGQFEVFRMETPEQLPEPLGALSGLLTEAFDQLKELDPSSPRLSSRPPYYEGEPLSHVGLVTSAREKAPEPSLETTRFNGNGEIAPPQAFVEDSPATSASMDPDIPAPPSLPTEAMAFADGTGAPSTQSSTLGEPSPEASAPAESAPPEPAAAAEAPEGTPQPSAVHAASSAPSRRSSSPPATRSSRPLTDITALPRVRLAPPGKIVAIASPKGGCGKTTVALNLALSLARQGSSVTLVDADINGDVLSSINARQRAEIGAYDVLLGIASSDEALLDTVLPHFKIMPAVGGQLPRHDALSADHSASWRALLLELGRRSEIVLIDTPAGMFGATHQVLQSSTHVLGVLQAEVVANRSFSRFVEALRAMPDERRPEVLGIVVNMLQTRHSASLAVFQSACSEMPGDWLFENSIPRHRAFLDATQLGVPLRQLDEQSPPAVAFLFDNLAAEVAERLRLGAVEKKPQPLLL
jgi:cellulose biosynthesis protein BcsQ